MRATVDKLPEANSEGESVTKNVPNVKSLISNMKKFKPNGLSKKNIILTMLIIDCVYLLLRLTINQAHK